MQVEKIFSSRQPRVGLQSCGLSQLLSDQQQCTLNSEPGKHLPSWADSEWWEICFVWGNGFSTVLFIF